MRNWLAGEDAGDIDLATQLLPQEVMKRLKAAGIKVVPTGIDHGTVTAVIDKTPYEITTLRRDVETDGRHAIVSFTDDWLEDAERRDFTINTLSANLHLKIFDPLGRGVDDLKKGKIVFVGNPAERIAEDYLRVLRFFRFYARYGKGKPDKAALAACAVASRKIKTLSKERVTQELLKILQVPKSPSVLQLMRDINILKGVIASSYQVNALTKLIKQQKDKTDEAMAARLVMLAGLKRSGVTRIKEELRLPNKMITQMLEILSAIKTLDVVSDHSVKLSLYRHGIDLTRQALLIKGAPAKFMKLEAVPVFPVTGKMLLKEGFTAGPAMGRELKRREAAWIKAGLI